MTIREIIEARAREAAERVGNDAGLAWDTKELTEYIQTIIIAILTDPQVGFKEALEALSFEPQDCETDNCVHEWAGKQLKELEELK